MNKALHIIVTADIHGNLLPSDGYSGLAGIKSYCRQNDINDENSIYIDLGDILLGTNLAHYFSAVATGTRHPFLSLLERLNCKAFVPGNHDFNYGRARLREIQQEASFPFLLANIVNKESGESITGKEYELFNVAGSRIAVIGLTGRAVFFENRDWFAHDLEYRDEEEVLKELIPEIKAGYDPDLIVVAYHGGLEKDPDTGKELIKAGENKAVAIAENIADIDILLTSHQHKLVNTIINNCLLIQPGKKAQYFGHITVERGTDCEGGYSINCRLLSTRDLEPDPEYIDRGSIYREKLDQWQQQTLCRLQETVIIEDVVSDLCLQKNILVDWLHVVQLQAGPADISAAAVVGSNFENMELNRLQRGDIINFFPYRDYPVIIEMSIEEIKKVLEYSYTMFDYVNSARDYQIAGSWQEPHFQIYLFHLFANIYYKVDFSRERGSRIIEVRYKNETPGMDRTLKVVMSEYSFEQLKSLELINRGKNPVKLEDRIQDLLMKSAENQETLKVPELSKWELTQLRT